MGSHPQAIIGISLKMYLGVRETRDWLRAVADLSRAREHVELFVAPSFLSLAEAVDIVAGTSVRLGAQDVFWEERGPFTGEVSATMLREVGCTYAEVGHAERRRLFGEDDRVTARKAAAAGRAGLVPVVCIGELERSNADAAAHACFAQIDAVLDALPGHGEVVFAYEPVWAIGASAPAPPDHVVQVAARLRRRFGDRPGSRLIYGGAAGPGLRASLGDAVDGLFLGRFAHDVDNLRAILDEWAVVPTGKNELAHPPPARGTEAAIDRTAS
jgi:triosephosphate isomerase